ncbi:hypothetical protein P4O66_004205 [Electrophorus voltai]|uniref:MICAL-like protein 2 n=1 Tax=Electrophorus voltai TaxID=2609070 RepID=A0AAD9E331_9TELE|nr:hypothetical protein P4O66_004205 [Electrophorus voltai]
MAAIKALQQWCKIQCEGYKDVAITNMTTSFRDGLAFCALIHKHRPDLIDFDSLRKENVYENNHLAFGVAEKELGIPALLDAEDMVALKVPDRLSILTYVSQYYNYFHGRSPIGGIAGVKRPAEESREEVSGKRNQPVTAKVFGSPKEVTENKREILVEHSNKPGTLSSSCSVCNKHVHLVQRHLVDGKLYHRNCFKCSECASILLSGTYKPGKEPNTFICRTHQSTQKLPTPQARQVPLPLRDSQPIPATRAMPSSKATPSTNTTSSVPAISCSSPSLPADLVKASTTSRPSPHWLAGKSDILSTPTPSPRSKLTPAHSSALPPPVKSPMDKSAKAEPLKPPSSTVVKNQEARQRFFEMSSSSGSTGPITRSTLASQANENAGLPVLTAPAVVRTNKNASLPVVMAPEVVRTNEKAGLPMVTTTAVVRTNENVSLPVVTVPAVVRTNESTALPVVTVPAMVRTNKNVGLPVVTAPAVVRTNEKAGLPMVTTTAVVRTNEKAGLPVVMAPAVVRTNKNIDLPLVMVPAMVKTNENVSLPVVTAPAVVRTNESTALSVVTAPVVVRTNKKSGLPMVTTTAVVRTNKNAGLPVVTTPAVVRTNKNIDLPLVMVPGEVRTNENAGLPMVPAPAVVRTNKNACLPIEMTLTDVRTNENEGLPVVMATAVVRNNKKAATGPPLVVAPASGEPAKGRVLLRVGDWAKDKEKDKENEKKEAKSVINKMFTEEIKKSSSPSRMPAGLKTAPARSGTSKDSTAASVPTKEPEKKPETTTQPSLGKSQVSGHALATTSSGSTNDEQCSSALPSQVTNGTALRGKAEGKLKPDYIPKEKILQELKEIENSLDELEKQGVELEKQLRRYEEEGKGDVLMNDSMVDWFNLIRNKQVYMRRESELVYIGRTQDLEEEQPNVEAELRKLMAKPDHLKTYRERKREEELIAKLVEIVDDRNAIVDGLDEDRIREEEEDEQLNRMMQDLVNGILLLTDAQCKCYNIPFQRALMSMPCFKA